MHKEHTPDDPEMLAQMRYDTRDFSMGQVGAFVIGLIVFGIVGIVISLVIFMGMNPGIMDKNKVAAPFARKSPPAPNPILQTNVTAKTDLQELRAAENDKLHNYGYADSNKTTVHVPVDRAIEILSNKGAAGK